MNDILSTVILFTYRRVPKKLIDSLFQNKLAQESSLIIYSDGNKNSDDKSEIEEVRKYLKTIIGKKRILLKAWSFDKYSKKKGDGYIKADIDRMTFDEVDDQKKLIVHLLGVFF